MTGRGSSSSRGDLSVPWRTLEWWGCGLALFLQTGAVFPLLVEGLYGAFDASAAAKLRLLALPPYGITIILLVRHQDQLLLALRRNLIFPALLVLPLVSVLWSVSPSVSLRRAIGLVLSVALAYVLAIRFTPRQLLALVGAVLVPCVVGSLCGAVLVPHLAWTSDAPTLRGIFLHKNVLGWYAAMAVLVCGCMTRQGSPVSQRIAWLCLPASLFCLFASASMTGIMAITTVLTLAPFYLALPRVRGPAKLLLVLLALEVAILLLVGLQAYLVPALEALGKDATLTGRVPLWLLVDEYIWRQPLIGYGYKAFWNGPEAWGIWGAIGWNAPHAHNGYREILLSFGLVGLVPFLIVLAGALRQGALLHCHAPRDGWIWLNVLLGMLIVMNLTESRFMEQNDFIFILCSTAIIMFSMQWAELGRKRWQDDDRLALPPVGYL